MLDGDEDSVEVRQKNEIQALQVILHINSRLFPLYIIVLLKKKHSGHFHGGFCFG